MDKLIIVNWLLTRRCNLSCSYCGIVREPHNKNYPSMDYYTINEMSTKYVLEILERIHKHNPFCFHIFYGGEPLLREDLPEIINFCNDKKIYYTIITNNSDEVQPALERLFEKTEYVDGLTSSVDPVIFSGEKETDRYKKSLNGLNRLIALKDKVKDLVAEITIDNKNIESIEPLVKVLDENGITSSITFVDISKNDHYDFSNVTNEKMMVYPSDKVWNILKSLIDKNYDVHMSQELLKNIYDILPSNLDCKLLDSFHNLTIDADGKIRLCLRVKGYSSIYPNAKVINFIDKNGEVNWEELKNMLRIDKIFACKGCNWTCQIMSKMILDSDSKDTLLHLNKRS